MAKIEFPRVLNIYETKEKAIVKLDTIQFTYGMPAVIRYKDSSTGAPRCILAVGTDDGFGKYRIVNSNEKVSYYSTVRYREETDKESIERTFYGKEVNAGDIFQLVTLKNGKTVDTVSYIYSGKSWEPLVNMISASRVILNLKELGEGLTLDDVLDDMLTKIASGGITWSEDSDILFEDVTNDENIKKIRASFNLYTPLAGEYPNAIIKKNKNQLYAPDYSGELIDLGRKLSDVESTLKNIQTQNKWAVDNSSIIFDDLTKTYMVGKVDGGNL